MKHGNKFFMEISREPFIPGKYNLSAYALALFYFLNECEQRYTGKEEDFFFQSNRQIMDALHWSEPTIKKAKRELEQAGLIKTWPMHWIDDETGKKSAKHVTAYRILK